MNIHVDKSQENANSRPVSEVTPLGDSGPFQLVDHRSASTAQRKLQHMANLGPQAGKVQEIQRMADHACRPPSPVQKKENNTGLPDTLKSGIENLSGHSMDDVKVHYNSGKPAQLNALAYAQGSDIHLAPGQERHLPHEAWHVVQQKQGRVRPTMQMKGSVGINDDAGLEKEADIMGAKALGASSSGAAPVSASSVSSEKTVQRFIGFEFQMLSSDASVNPAADGAAHAKWAPTEDGKNLEMKTTKILTAQDEVAQVVGEISTLGARMATARPGDVIQSGNQNITVRTPDSNAQPQVNFDMRLDSLGDNLVDNVGGNTLHRLLGAGMFGADNPAFGWNPEKTAQQMTVLRNVFSSVENSVKDVDVLKNVFGKGPSTPYPVTFSDEFRGYLMAMFSQRYQTGAKDALGLIKDVPFLIKTDLNQIRAYIVDQIAECYAEPDKKRIGEGLDKLAEKFMRKISEDAGIDPKVAEKGSKVMAGENGNLYDFPVQPSSDQDGIYKGILIELRRAPIIPYTQWTAFALQSFQLVGRLFEPKQEGDD
jgi:hypothetical protein